jgi:hypothetical protein
MFSLEKRSITLTIGEHTKRVDFASEEQMQAALEEWLRLSKRKNPNELKE